MNLAPLDLVQVYKVGLGLFLLNVPFCMPWSMPAIIHESRPSAPIDVLFVIGILVSRAGVARIDLLIASGGMVLQKSQLEHFERGTYGFFLPHQLARSQLHTMMKTHIPFLSFKAGLLNLSAATGK